MDKGLGGCLCFLLSLGGKKCIESSFIDSSVCGNTKHWLCLLKSSLCLIYGHPSVTFKGRALPRQFGRREVSLEQADPRSSLAVSSFPRGKASIPNRLSHLGWQS